MIKKISIFIFLILFPLVVFARIPGDVNNNGKIDVNDYLLVRKHMMKIISLTGEDLKAADIDGNNSVSISDYIYIKKVMLKLIPTANESQEDDKDKYVATFIVQGKNQKVSCVASPNGCDVSVPNIIVDNYEMLGYAKTMNSKDVDIKVGSTINIKKNVTYYGVISRKIKATFVVQDTKNITSSKTSKSCTLYNDDKECEITSSTLTAKSGYSVIGWSTKKNTKEATVKSNSKVKISDDITYYSISKKDTALVAKFVITAKASKDGDDKKCHLYNGNSSCTITSPKITANSGFETVGWTESKNSTTALASSGGSITLTKDTTFYSLVKKTVTITYDVNENITDKDITKSNIKAEKLSFYSASCVSYNDNGCNITMIPTIYSSGNYVHGFATTKNGECINVVKTTFKKNTTLYARVYNAYRDWNIVHIDTQYSKTYGNIVVEIQNTVTLDDMAYFINYLDVLYKNTPQLFYFNGKVILTEKDIFDSLSTEYVNHGGVITGAYSYSVIYVSYLSTSSIKNRCRTVVHEIGHAYDREFYNIFGKSIRDRAEISDKYNKYMNKSSAERPMRDYSYTKIQEFVADMVRFSSYRYFEENKIYYVSNGKRYKYYTLESTSNPITDDLYEIYKGLMKEGLDYYKKIGRIS